MNIAEELKKASYLFREEVIQAVEAQEEELIILRAKVVELESVLDTLRKYPRALNLL